MMHPELYKPLNIMIDEAEALLLNKETALNHKQREHMRNIRNIAGALVQIIDTIPGAGDQTINSLRSMPDTFIKLRTHVNTAIGYTKMLLHHPENYGGDTFNSAQRQHLEHIDDAAQQLLRMIEDMMDYLRLRLGMVKLYLGYFDAGSPIFWASEVYHLLGDEPVSLSIVVEDGLPMAYGDEFRTYQIYRILIANAIKFTHKGHVKAHLRALNNSIELAVEDTGIGIAPEDREKVFEPYYQFDSEVPGLGMGLYLSRALSNLQGSDLRFDSIPSKGTTFYFTIPTQPQE